MYRNATYAFVDSLRTVLKQGEKLTIRGSEVMEVRARLIQLSSPTERTYVLPERRNNIFATIAETVWVLAGRNDIGYLTRYLPRAVDFSDEGTTWRAGYGPRLRDWHGKDQVGEVVHLLRADPSSRRAVISLFDPAADFTNSKDIPCNNWLQFMIRDGLLHMHATIRSNDAMWGFSGINTFEWSVLQEMMAFWTDTSVGTFSYFIGSFHVYDHHYGRARKIVDSFSGSTLYDYGIHPLEFATSFEALADVLARWFDIEGEIVAGSDVSKQVSRFPDPFLRGCLQMLDLFNRHQAGAESAELIHHVMALPRCDFRVAAVEYFRRMLQDNEFCPLEGPEADFLATYRAKPASGSLTFTGVFALLSVLHGKKTRVYKNAWKKRGEIIGVMANIARKYDRLEVAMSSETDDALADESLVDTLADLATYAAKYLTFLADQDPGATLAFMVAYKEGVPIERYQENEGFDAVGLVLEARFLSSAGYGEMTTLGECFSAIESEYADLEELLLSGDHEQETRRKCEDAADLAIAAIGGVILIGEQRPALIDEFARSVRLL